MSLIARCPACGTLFRVVPDQLKISQGWVRCGQCAEVFDANQTLQQLAGAPTQAPEAAAPAAPDDASGAAVVGVQVHDLLPSSEEASLAVLDDRAPEEAPPAADLDSREPVLEPGPLVAQPEVQIEPGPRPPPSDPTFEPPSEPLPESLTESPADASPPTASAQQDVSFVRQARRRAFWRRRGVRLTLAVLAGGLALLLAGQVAYHQRDRLASQVPALQPVLVALCEALQCRLGAPQRIEAIAIESSAFTRLRADAFRLNLTLNNQAQIALAVPALELTLTDLQDQPVLRRVLQPVDLGPDTPAAIAPRTEWSSTLTVGIAPGVDPARIVGYRVLAFYP